MAHEISIETAVEILESAFAPLHCLARTEDHANSVVATVRNSSGEILLDLGNLTKERVTNAKRFKAILIDARERLEDRGFSLSAWEFPSNE